MNRQLPAGVAAGHPATAAAGLEVLAAGGSAADAVAAMVLAGSVAETIFSGLAGGGFAIHFDAADNSIVCHDFFVAVPGLDGSVAATGQGISVSFGGVQVPYDIGGPTVAVPGNPRGVEHLHRVHGRLPWSAVVNPAVNLARAGAAFPSSHAELLPDVQAAMLLDAGVDAYSLDDGKGGRSLLAAEGRLFHEGLAQTLELYRDGGADEIMTGEFGRRFVDAVRLAGGGLSATDMAAYQVKSAAARTVQFGDNTLHLRGDDLDDLAGTFARFDGDFRAAAAGADLKNPDAGANRALALAQALDGSAKRGDTTSVVAVDSEGNACAATHSLGLGSGVWVGGVHANSMLGEGELIRGDFVPGQRMGSMMSPMIATDGAGRLLLAGGAAGGSRIRSALLQVVSSVLREGFSAREAVDRPRLSVAGQTVHLEPGFGTAAIGALTGAGYQVNQWSAQKPYFGGAAIVDRTGFAGDPRRGGLGRSLS